MWKQKNLTLPPKPAGFHLITQEVLLTMPEITKCGKKTLRGRAVPSLNKIYSPCRVRMIFLFPP